MHSFQRTWTGGIGVSSYLSLGTYSIQSPGQNGTQAEQPVQLSSSTTAIERGRFFLELILSGSSGTDFK